MSLADELALQETLLKEKEVAQLLNIGIDALRQWRFKGNGPRFLKLGASVRYEPKEIADFLLMGTRRCASDKFPQVLMEFDPDA